MENVIPHEALPEEYIGDGVFVSFDGYHIVLDLRGQDSSRICLEPVVMQRLKLYESKVKDWINAPTNEER